MHMYHELSLQNNEK